jgi:outer membrane protein, multidrug efflux system
MRSEEKIMNAFPLKRLFLGLVWSTTLMAISACSLAPIYEKPSLSMPPAYKEERTQAPLKPAEAGTWKTAQPSEELARGQWWTAFDDSTLNDLERQAIDAN